MRTRSLRVYRQCCKAWRIPAVLLKFVARIFHDVLELHMAWIEVVNSSQVSSIAELRLVKKLNVVFLFVELLSTFVRTPGPKTIAPGWCLHFGQSRSAWLSCLFQCFVLWRAKDSRTASAATLWCFCCDSSSIFNQVLFVQIMIRCD